MFSFGCLLTAEEREQNRRSRDIDRWLAKDANRLKGIKLLTLGTSGSGQSTFIKQMRIIHGKGYSHEERLDFRRVIHENVVSAMQELLRGIRQLNIPLSQEMKTHAQVVEGSHHSVINQCFISVELYQSIKSLWQDPAIVMAFERRMEYDCYLSLPDSAKYYLDNLDRLCAEGYVPTEQDILRARQPTCGIQEYIFMVNDLDFLIVEVGGSRSCGRRWMHVWDCVTAIVFVVAADEFDQPEYRDNAGQEVGNRLQESCTLFQRILSYPWFQHAAIILFLNKKDLLEEKIKTSHLVDYFPQFDGEKGDYYAARRFISSMFINSVPERSKDIYPHYTCATDTENMRVVFDQVKSTIREHHRATKQL